ncbi:kinase-like domain-containing protein [Rhizophagus irregularis DAOM 181602=DAOM 197198]|nr:kinase-like domain-containing protein [Rhizophagus irregularis DAOM 181602=DAOM 197198]
MPPIRKELIAAINKAIILVDHNIHRNIDQQFEFIKKTVLEDDSFTNDEKDNFLKWTSGNNELDNLIQKCQMESLEPEKIIEWIPFNNLQNINYLTKGGFSEIYSADWIDGHYNEWDSNERQLRRFGRHKVILKRLGSFESANYNWFGEVCNLNSDIVICCYI